MNDEYYYTENIRLNKNNKLEYNKKDKFIQIKDSNWHHILSECGWEKINKQWIILLNRLSDKKRKIHYLVLWIVKVMVIVFFIV